MTTTMTEELLDLYSEIRKMEHRIGALIERSNEEDYVPDADGEYHPLSINRDIRWDMMDAAWTKIHDSVELISLAHDASLRVDTE